MNRAKYQKAATVWFDFAKYLFLAAFISGFFVQPINWRVVVIGLTVGSGSYLLGLITEPKDKEEKIYE